MPDQKANQHREEARPRGTSKASAKPAVTASQGSSPRSARSGRNDEERAIERGREGSRSTSVSRRQQTPPLYGAGQGALSPYSTMRRMADDMDRLFESFGLVRTGLGQLPMLGAGPDGGSWSDLSALEQSAWTPQVEAFRRGDKLVVRADLPGLRKEDVKVEVEDGVLEISGERREEHEEDRDDYYRSERSYGQFYRAIPLPDGVDESRCEASFRDGVLEVTVPAPQQGARRTKQIQVK